MLVLLGPKYSGRDDELDILAAETGLAMYDLRTRLRPGAWSVVRAVADIASAEHIAGRLASNGLQACALDAAVGRDPLRRIVYLRGIEVQEDHLVLRMIEREMIVPLGALLTIVRGDVHVGRTPPSISAQMVVPTPRSSSGATALSAANPAPHEVFVAADLHFVTVSWLARIDARDCEYGGHRVDQANRAETLDRFIDDLGAFGRIRVDRHVKSSSVAAHTSASSRVPAPLPAGPSSSRWGGGDEHFDAYSRMVGEAERLTYGTR